MRCVRPESQRETHQDKQQHQFLDKSVHVRARRRGYARSSYVAINTLICCRRLLCSKTSIARKPHALRAPPPTRWPLSVFSFIVDGLSCSSLLARSFFHDPLWSLPGEAEAEGKSGPQDGENRHRLPGAFALPFLNMLVCKFRHACVLNSPIHLSFVLL